MALAAMKVRWVGGVAVVGVGPRAAGDPLPPGVGLTEFCADGRGLVIDLAGCEVPSSELLGVMIRGHQAAVAVGDRLRVCCPPGLVREALTATRLHRVLPLFATLADALADFDPPAG